jgi:hypothetical protein
MSSCTVYHVRSGPAGWEIRLGYAEHVSSLHLSRSAATVHAIQLAKGHYLSRVEVHDGGAITIIPVKVRKVRKSRPKPAPKTQKKPKMKKTLPTGAKKSG